MWEDFSSTVGFWADMEHPYVTYYDDYIESEWWALKEIWNKAFCIKASRLFLTAQDAVLLFPAQEVSQGYKIQKERSAIARFKVVGGCILPGMDHNTMDTSFQCCTLRKPG